MILGVRVEKNVLGGESYKILRAVMNLKLYDQIVNFFIYNAIPAIEHIQTRRRKKNI